MPSGGFRRLTSAAATDWALGIQARSQALLSRDEEAEGLYVTRSGGWPTRSAPSWPARTPVRRVAAREGRRRDARDQLRTAYEMLDAMGMRGFAERARKELVATGETVRKRTAGTANQLTAQEAQIARLARTGAQPGDQHQLSSARARSNGI